MNVSIDRIEEGVAVLLLQDDPRERITVPAALIPSGCGEGDILTLTLEADPATTRATKVRVSGLIEKLKKKNSRNVDEPGSGHECRKQFQE